MGSHVIKGMKNSVTDTYIYTYSLGYLPLTTLTIRQSRRMMTKSISSKASSSCLQEVKESHYCHVCMTIEGGE